ncbi:FAD-dependent oxidoreductase [Streptococcus sp. zg-JUN1979]|uniref:FAD-dependent oxidoreductase n=1 Tax=Streptococcus sp. zg-JUN1979 TaxID=3391450 RepID=UPI0039A5AA1B
MSKQKIVIVGASHGGHESAIRILDKYDNVEVTIYEAGDFVSFMSCGMELFLEGKTIGQDYVRNFSPEELEARGGKVINNHQVTAIQADAKTISVKNVLTNQEENVSYDKLILSVGVEPIELNLPGKNLDNIYFMHGHDWASKINAAQTDESIQNVVVIGSGYIGVEATQVFAKAGKHVTLVDMIDNPLGNYLNSESTAILEPAFRHAGVELHMGATVEAFLGEGKVSALKTNKGEIPADLVIVAVGVYPNTKWLEGVIDLDERGYIKTDAYLRTNVEDVFAVGDATLQPSIPANQSMPIALATTTRRSAFYLASTLFDKKPARAYKGVVGSSALGIFGYKFATSGLNEFSAGRLGLDFETSFYTDRIRPRYIPEADNPEVYVSLTFHPKTHQILGGSVLSTQDLTAQGNVLSLAIAQKLTLEDLAEADFFFQPGFDRQWSLLNLAAQDALGYKPF